MFKNILKKEAGFTLIEMLIVLLIISVLIILIVPNLSSSSKEIDKKGCDALVTVVQTQVNLFYLEKRKYPDNFTEMITGNYISSDQTTCSNNQVLNYDHKLGVVTKPVE